MSMWAVNNRTPYAVKKSWGIDKDGVKEWLVAVKATYDIKRDGSLTLADEQPEPLLLPEYRGEDGQSSLQYEAEVTSPKPTTDVLINGTAYAPKGRPSNEFLVSLRIGRIHKEIRVVGNRRWERGILGLTRSETKPVTEVPIVYERAFGGFDQADPNPKKQQLDLRNPVGCGLVPREQEPLPNLEYPNASLKKGGPAGFGAIACYWSPRRELHGTYDEAWQNSRLPLVPVDWDPRSLLCSPADQRPDKHLHGGESVELINLTPAGKLTFTLPKVYLTFTTNIDNRYEEHRSRLSTVILEPDHPRVIMVWQTSLVVRSNMDYLEETVVREKRYI